MFVEDAGFSGKSIAGRPGMTRVLEMVKARKIDHIVILKLDRLADLKKPGNCCTLQKKNVGLPVSTSALTHRAPRGNSSPHILSAMNEWERATISERTKTALQKKGGRERISNHAPFGFHSNDGKVVKDATEQRIIERTANFTPMVTAYAE